METICTNFFIERFYTKLPYGMQSCRLFSVSQSVLSFFHVHKIIGVQVHLLQQGMSQQKGVTPQMLLMKKAK